MTKVWARELGRKGIRVNAVAPGFIETRLTTGIPDKVVAKLLERIAMGYFGQPEDVANAFLWLPQMKLAMCRVRSLAWTVERLSNPDRRTPTAPGVALRET